MRGAPRRRGSARTDGTPARPAARGARAAARRAAPDSRPAVGRGSAAADPAGRREPHAQRLPRRAGGPRPDAGERLGPGSRHGRSRSPRCARCRRYAAGRIADAVRYIEAADRLLATAADEHLAEWLDAIAWLCWTETFMGRHGSARRPLRPRPRGRPRHRAGLHRQQPARRARTRRTPCSAGWRRPRPAPRTPPRLARLLGSGQQLVFALTQQCLARELGRRPRRGAVRLGAEAVDTGGGRRVVGRPGPLRSGASRWSTPVTWMPASPRCWRRATTSTAPRLDLGSLIFCCETLARVEAARGRSGEAARWADRAEQIATSRRRDQRRRWRSSRAPMRWSPATRRAPPRTRRRPRGSFSAAELRIDAGRARLRAGIAYAAAGDRTRRPRTSSRAAADDLRRTAAPAPCTPTPCASSAGSASASRPVGRARRPGRTASPGASSRWPCSSSRATPTSRSPQKLFLSIRVRSKRTCPTSSPSSASPPGVGVVSRAEPDDAP